MLDVEGVFWAAESPERRVRGRLSFDRRVGELVLEAILRVVPDASTDRIDVIHGRALTDEMLCLVDCFVHATDFAARMQQAWTTNEALVGTDQAHPAVRAVTITTDALRPFYGHPRLDPLEQEHADNRDMLTLRWRSSPTVSVPLGELTVVFDDDWSVDGTASDLTLRARPRLQVRSPTDTTRDALSAVVGPLLVMVGVFAGAPVDEFDETLELTDASTVRYLTGYRPRVAALGAPKPWLALGNLQPLERTVPAWLALHDELPQALAMLAEFHRAGASTPWEDRLLYLARFVEQFHRARNKSLRLPKNEFRARRKQVRDAVGGPLGKWAFDLLEHANERRLSERAQELVEGLGPVVADVLPDPAGFAKQLTDTRNFYTHYPERLEAKAARGWDLVLLTNRLWLMIRALLLRELGFSDNESRTLLELDGGLGWLLREGR